MAHKNQRWRCPETTATASPFSSPKLAHCRRKVRHQQSRRDKAPSHPNLTGKKMCCPAVPRKGFGYLTQMQLSLKDQTLLAPSWGGCCDFDQVRQGWVGLKERCGGNRLQVLKLWTFRGQGGFPLDCAALVFGVIIFHFCRRGVVASCFNLQHNIHLFFRTSTERTGCVSVPNSSR